MVALETQEGSAYGAALLALAGIGEYGSVPEACRAAIRQAETVSPAPPDAAFYNKGPAAYRALYPALKPIFKQIAERGRAAPKELAMLHVTNGTSVSLDQSGLGGEVLTWVDVLHEGPVPEGLDLRDLSRLRGKYLDGAFSGRHSAVADLASRDAALSRFAEHEEVVLWFEHDLYDQLQLIQILDWFHGRTGVATLLSLICIDNYLGRLTGPQLADLWPGRHAVTVFELELAAAAWQAFRSPDPTRIEDLLRGDTTALPFLAGALLRHLQQFPAVENGLARTESQILELVEAGNRDFRSLFAADQRREERIFMGDLSFARYVRGLCDCRHPLLAGDDVPYELTPTGRDVLGGRADHVRLNGVNRWLGGVHLSGSEALWRWDEQRRRLAAH